MTRFGHEKLDVYRLALEYVAWSKDMAAKLPRGSAHARDQLLRAGCSIPLNIAEANGRGTFADRRRFFEIARGSALEYAATQDVLEVTGDLDPDLSDRGKAMLARIVSMLTRLVSSDGSVREEEARYACVDGDYDNDCDYDGSGLDGPASNSYSVSQ